MRGNWESAESLVLTPNQQLPQQQQSMMEDHHPLHSPTTPAWSITDRIVKEEPTEDKNNDSGVSPGHYTSTSGSPRSRRSSSIVNCSLSPGSATSGDSQAIPCSNYDYSPPSLFKNCTSPLEFPRIPGIDEISGPNGITQPMDISGMNNGSDESDIGQDNLQCPICQFATQNRLQFTEHLAGHYAARDTSDYQRPLYPNLSVPQLSPMDDSNRASPPSGSERSEQDSEETEEPGVRTPRVNSQGKVKTFRCKQCNFVAVTKLDFWEHSRSHIKVDKLLTCPKCPFVTEYKHHLEYHLRNHFGSKPFKCDKCSYSCVNKSMLNSHLKSHSNVYQYRCANCSYATKYCHSLKLHLRKYNHQPAMVLNADGSPNPLPIIDVYGTRRGPKQKPIAQKSDDKPGSNPQSPQLASHMTPLSPLSINNGFNPMMAFNPFNTIFTGFPVVNNYVGDDSEKMDGFKTNLFAEYAKAMVADRLNADLPQEVSNYNFNSEITSTVEKNASFDLPESVTMLNKMDDKGSNGKCNMGAPLDLSKPELSINNNNDDKDRDYDFDKIDNSPKTNGKNRRKGKAVKLNRQVQLVDADNYDKDSDNKDSEHEDDKDDCDKSTNNGSSNEFSCQYCEIAFGNEVMYTVHMGYHGYKDPFTCNMCGHQCDDKVSFFLHIARSKHA